MSDIEERTEMSHSSTTKTSELVTPKFDLSELGDKKYMSMPGIEKVDIDDTLDE